MKLRKYILFFVLLVVIINNSCFASNDTTNTKEFKKLPDTTQIRILVEMSDLCEIDEIINYTNKAIEIGKKIIAKSPQSEYVKYYAAAYNNEAFYYDQVGNIKGALESYLKSLGIREAINDSLGMAESYNNLAYLFQNQGDLSSAINYYNKSKKIFNNFNDTNGLINVYINLGYTYYSSQKQDSAQLLFEKGLELAEKVGDIKGTSYALNNLASIYDKKGLYEKSETTYLKSLALRTKMGNKDGITRSHINLGRFYFKRNNFEKSVEHANKAYQLALSLKSPDVIGLSSMLLSDIYHKKNNFKEAYIYLATYVEMKDSILNDDTRKTTIKQKIQYEYEKQKALDDKEHEKQIAISVEQKKKQQVIIYYTAGGLGLVILFSVVIFNRLQITRKQKLVIEYQKQEVESQKLMVELKNKEITDSITYAKRIQKAILPSHKRVKEYLPDSFVLYNPKDVISGDFYWMEASPTPTLPKGEGENPPPVGGELEGAGAILFAAADCTGHGVPGAMVSVVCNNALNRSVREYGITEPGKILDKTREIVVQEFEKSDEDVKDGMDISLCSLMFKVRGLKLTEPKTAAMLHYAGANNPLWIIRSTVIASATACPDLSGKQSLQNEQIASRPAVVRNDEYEIIEYKPNKQSIGKTHQPQLFTTHNIELQKGDTIYVFTDGYADQFGGEKGKKLMYKPFKELLLSIQNKTMSEQKVVLEQHFETWKGKLEQVDDVCIIGVRI